MLSYERMSDEPVQRRTKGCYFLACLTLILATAAAFLGTQKTVRKPIGLQAGERPAGEEEVVVHLKSGSVRGLQTPWYGRRFRGIPFGSAKRWQNAELAEDIKGDFDARAFSASCMREASHFAEPMSEDCLHLNIYTPILTSDELEHHIPVVVWFHGGSFTMGAGSDSHAEDVQELVTTDRLIVVTINYRLGIFGFLGSERLRHAEGNSVGNFGTLDQQVALRWVGKHIQYFGGDTSRIGLMGWSAGAASISVHLSMPSSAGLFRTAIMMSGGFTEWAAQTMKEAENDYEDILAVTGCDKSPACLAAGPPCPCLLSKSAEELVTAQSQVPAVWAPTIDGTTLKQHPTDALASGNSLTGIPIIIGGTLEDSLQDIGANATVAHFENYMQEKRKVPPSMLHEAKQIYLEHGRPHAGKGLERWSPAYWAARDAGADSSMNCVARRAAREWQAQTSAAAYWYLWANQPSDRYADPAPQPEGSPFTVGGCWPCPGATHGADLPYIFERNEVNVDSDNADLADLYQIFFRDMVERQDPNQWRGEVLSEKVDGTLKLAWPPMPTGGLQFEAGAVRWHSDLKAAECDFWDRVASL